MVTFQRSDSFASLIFAMLPIQKGITPDNLFSPTSSISNFVQLLNEDGRFPIKLFSLSINDWSSRADPIVEGISPDKLLLLKSKYINDLKLFQQPGILPDKRLNARSNTPNLLSIPLAHINKEESENLFFDISRELALLKNGGIDPSN
ncbi:hypothetical protein Lal_00028462 [Lupinus albus]|nr:hypothetical protein Lal_00028462 [Lupinus albus]